MEKYIENWKIITDILGALGSLSFAILLVINIITLKNLFKSNAHSNEIVGMCMSKFSVFSEKLRLYNNKKEIDDVNNLIYRYFDLCNEELFYIKNGVVSPEVSKDWMTGMIRQMILFREQNEYKNILSEFPRIGETFNFNFDTITNNQISSNIIANCLNNLKKYN